MPCFFLFRRPSVRWRKAAQIGHLGKAGLSALFLLAASGAAFAQSGDRWQADETSARAVLPAPAGDSAFAGAEMVCEERRWRFELAMREDRAASGGSASIGVDRASFEADAVPAAPGLAVGVPTEALEPLRRGLSLEFSFEEEGLGRPRFSLAGSRVAMEAMEAACLRPDMSAYDEVTFTPDSFYMALAGQLREADVEAFRVATASEPELTAAMAEFGEGRRILFTKMCGSAWYHGVTGCNVTGFAPAGANWRVVYSSEGVLLHIDRAGPNGSWPDLVSLPARGRGERIDWRWDGTRYQPHFD